MSDVAAALECRAWRIGRDTRYLECEWERQSDSFFSSGWSEAYIALDDENSQKKCCKIEEYSGYNPALKKNKILSERYILIG